ncbi:putative PPE family protein PPE38 [Mycobacterium kansasii]|nr:putative PPE family protein PPE38 [Mycobacterium kansasii]VAZ74767.1 putative PPE family protein PPE38 [Mycobacterium kansasii]
MGAELGKARLVGAMSVPPTWEGSMPKGLSSAAMAGLSGVPTAAELAQAAGAAGTGGGMPMMPMPMGAGGAGAGMPGGMMGRGGANPHVVQARPSVIPRTGIG